DIVMGKASLSVQVGIRDSLPDAKTAVELAAATHHQPVRARCAQATIRSRSVAVAREMDVQGLVWIASIRTRLFGVECCYGHQRQYQALEKRSRYHMLLACCHNNPPERHYLS